MKTANRWHKRFLAAALIGSLATSVWAGGIDDFKLTRAIPADAFLAVHARDHEGLAFLNQQYQRLWEALEQAHLDRDLKRALKSAVERNQGDLEKFEQTWQKLTDLLAGVEWSTLCQREFAFAMKLEFPVPQFVVLMQPPADKVAADFEGLGGLLKALADLAPNELSFTSEQQGETAIRKLTFTQFPVPLVLTLACHKDVLGFGLGTAMIEQSLGMLRGETGSALASTPRFREAFKGLPSPTDGLVFVDLAKLMTQLRAYAAGAMEKVQKGETLDPQTAALPGKVIDAVDMFEYLASTWATQGMRTTSDTIALLREDAQSRVLYPAFFGTSLIREPLKYVPKEAADMWVWSGIDLTAFHQSVLDFLSKNVPNGEALIAQWNAAQQAAEFNLENDVLAWVGGGLGYFSIPGPTPYSPSEFVLMLTLRDEEKARGAIDRLLDAIEPHLAQGSGAIKDVEIEGLEGFRSISHMLLAMVGLAQPTLGVKNGLMFVGSSPKIIAKALAVGAGEAPSFAENERFIKEGLPPANNVTSLSFSDLSKLGEQLGQALSMASMLGTLSGGALMQDPGGRALLGVLTKLGNVARKLDFLQSTCSQSTLDGKLWRCKTVTNYREPPKPKIETPVEEGAPGEKQESGDKQEAGGKQESIGGGR